MHEQDYWQKASRLRLNRRRALSSAMLLATGTTAIGVVGCSSSNNNSSTAKTTQAPAATVATAAGAASRAAGSPSTGAASTAAPSTAQGIRGGTFHWNGGATLDLWDPHWNASSYTLSPMLALVFNKLMKNDSPLSNNKILPDLAQSWEQVNDTTLVVHLRKGVKFHNKAPMNGRELVAADVKWNIERQRDSKDPRFQRRYQYETVTDIQTPDNYTVQFQLKSPLAPFLSYLAGEWAFMIGHEVVEQYGDANREEAMIGTGPFVHQEFKPDLHHLQVRNPDYFLTGQPYFDASESVAVADAAALEAAFRTKKIDYTYLGSLPSPTVDKIRKDFPDVKYEPMGTLIYDYTRMAVDRPPFNDMRVRQALSASLNRKKAMDFALFGLGTLNGAGLPSNLKPWGLSEADLAKYPGYPNATDAAVADAKKLMEAAGYSDSKRLKFKIATGGTATSETSQLMEVGKEDWSKIYVDAEIAPEQYQTLLPKVTKRELDIWRGQDNGYADPDEYLYGSFHTGSSRNFFGYSNPELDALLEKQRTVLDQAARKAVIDQIQTKLMQELPQIGLHCKAYLYLWWPYLKNRKNSEWLNMYQMEEMWLDPADPSWKGRA